MENKHRLTLRQLVIEFLRDKRHCNFTTIAKVLSITKEEVEKEVQKSIAKIKADPRRARGRCEMEGYEMSTHLYCLLSENRLTLSEALSLRDLDLMRIRGMGVKSVRELRFIEDARNLKIKNKKGAKSWQRKNSQE